MRLIIKVIAIWAMLYIAILTPLALFHANLEHSQMDFHSWVALVTGISWLVLLLCYFPKDGAREKKGFWLVALLCYISKMLYVFTSDIFSLSEKMQLGAIVHLLLVLPVFITYSLLDTES